MEVRRAMFLRARDDSLAKIAYPLALGVFGKLSRTGLSEFQNGAGRFKHLPSNSAAERIGEK